MINALPKLPEFEYIKPETISKATQFLSTHAGEARPFLGGTDLFVQMRDRAKQAKFLVDIKGLEGMNDVRFDPVRGLTVGAAVNMNQVIASPDVQGNYVASYQLRTRATIIGNICNASPAGDTIGACLLLDGELNVHGVNGPRQEPLKDFFSGPGDTKLKHGDIVTSIRFPIPPEGLKGTYIKLGRNRLSDLAIVGVTVIGFPSENLPSGYNFRLALASVAPVPLVVDRVEGILGSEVITDERLAAAAQAAMDACTPIDDVRASAQYRKMMLRNLSFRALTEIWNKVKDD
jgi:carbon-monoxide dehydrogenase medium subunit